MASSNNLLCSVFSDKNSCLYQESLQLLQFLCPLTLWIVFEMPMICAITSQNIKFLNCRNGLLTYKAHAFTKRICRHSQRNIGSCHFTKPAATVRWKEKLLLAGGPPVIRSGRQAVGKLTSVPRLQLALRLDFGRYCGSLVGQDKLKIGSIVS